MNGSAFVLLLIGIAIFAIGVFGVLVLIVTLLRRKRKRPQPPENIPFHNISVTSQPPKSTPLQNISATPQAPTQLPVTRLPYERRAQLLTQAELTFFDVLCAATPDGLVVFPQMRLASIVDVAAHAQREYTHFNRIQAKCVDFVLCDAKSTAPRLVVELDDSSHNRADRRKRDRFVDDVLGNAGLPILHVRWQRQYRVEEIGSSIRNCLRILEVTPATAWSKPITVDTPINSLTTTSANVASIIAPLAPVLAVAEPINTRSRYVCGQCQQEVRRDAKFCSHCGSTL